MKQNRSDKRFSGRTLRVLAAVFMLAALFAVCFAAYAEHSLTMTDPTVKIGTTSVEVVVSYQADTTRGAAMLMFGIEYDTDVMTLKNVVTDTRVFPADAVTLGDKNKSPFRYLAYVTSGNIVKSGKLMTLTFTLKSGLQPGFYPIRFADVHAVTLEEMFNPVTTEDTHGITVDGNKFNISLNDETVVYDGKPHTLSVSGLPQNATVTGLEEKTVAGVYPQTVTISAPDYNTITRTPTLTISPKPLHIADIEALDKVYDGTKKAEIVGGTLVGIVGTDDVSAKYPTSGTFASVNVGSHISVSYTAIRLSGKDSGNYKLDGQPNLTASISKRPVTIRANDASKKEGDPDPELTCSVVEGELIGTDRITGLLRRAVGETPGTYEILRNNVTVYPAQNYDVTFIEGYLTITSKVPQTITAADIPDKIYGDETFDWIVEPDGTSGLNMFSFESSDNRVATVDSYGRVRVAGVGTVTLKAVQAGNAVYAPASVSKTFSVVRAPLTISVKTDKTTTPYSDTCMAKAETVYTGLVNGDTPSVLDAEAQIETVFTASEATGIYGTYTFTPNGAASKNYEIRYEAAEQTITVCPVQIVGLAIFPREENAEPVLNINGAALEPLYAGDTLEIDYSNAVVHAEGDKAVVSGITVKGDTDKYALSAQPIPLDAPVVDVLTAEDVAAALPEHMTVTSETFAPVLPEGFRVTGIAAERSDVLTKDGKVVPDKQDVTTNVTVTITGNAGASDTATRTISVTVPAKSVVKLTLVLGEHGSNVTGAGTYKAGETVSIRALAKSGYTFIGWYEGSKRIATSNPYDYLIEKDTTLTAKFQKNESDDKPGGGGGGGGGGYVAVEQVSKVVASAVSGAVEKGTAVTLSTATAGADIYYTTDNTVPNAKTSARYTEPIVINGPAVITAIAVKSGMTNSEPVVFTYRLKAEEVTEPDDGEDTDESGSPRIVLRENAAEIRYVTADSDQFRPDETATRYEVVEMLDGLFALIDVEPGKTFTDADEAHTALLSLYNGAGILDGYPDGTFGGERGITRAEFVKILAVMLGTETEVPQKPDTVDVADALSQTGTTFSVKVKAVPDSIEEARANMESAGESETEQTQTAEELRFADIAGHWSEGYVLGFVKLGYIVGYPDNTFRPDNNISRAEVVAVLNRISNHVKNADAEPRYADLTGEHWAYADIMSAVK